MNHPIFKYNDQYFGGTENMARGFIEKILPEMKNIQKYKCVILPGYYPDMSTWGLDGQETIVWLHNALSSLGGNAKGILSNPLIKKSIKYIICVSQYHKITIAKELDFPLDKIVVIPNASNPIEPTLNKFNNIKKPKLIHASSPERGMSLLLKSIPFVQEDFELNIFNDFYPNMPSFVKVDPKIFDDARVNFYGKTPQKIVHKFFADSHIHVYPSTLAETFCISQIEALSSGCFSIYSNLGGLPETAMGNGVMITELTPQSVAEEITKAIINIKTNGYDYSKQIKDFEDNFTWEVVKKIWLDFDKSI